MVLAALLGLLTAALAGALPARATSAPDLVGVVPSVATPSVLTSGTGSSSVLAIASVGTKVVLGGTFTQVTDAGGAILSAQNLLIYDSTTGLITARPTVTGTVETLKPGSKAGTVLVGGLFTLVNSTPVSNLALLDVATGQVLTSFKAPVTNNRVTDLEIVGNHLLVGGKFSTVDGKAQTSLVSLNPSTGKSDAWLSIAFQGHHNWKSGNVLLAKASVGITRMAKNPAGTKLVVIGNFTSVGGLVRDQMAVLDLTTTPPRVSSTWATTSLSSRCSDTVWDSWVRDVAVSPDGTYAVVANTGGGHFGTLCDGAARFDLNTRSRTVTPTWVASTGGDTLLSVAIAAKAVYVGGHMRWINNSLATDKAGAGAVPRPSLAALDPLTGVPSSWNPGRHPRGVGVSALLLTATGLLVGSDTDYVGNAEFLRPRIALLPLDTGSTLGSTAAPAYTDIYRAGAADQLLGETQRIFVGSAGAEYVWPDLVSTDIDWSEVRGAFAAGDRLWTAHADGSLVSQSFDGEVMGAAQAATPWADPAWKDQQTGSGTTQTYLGKASTLSTELASVAALTYSGGRLFYIKSGSTDLNIRWFNAESGIAADTSLVVRDVVIPATTTGLFVRGGFMYLGDADGSLTRRALLGRTLSTTKVVVGGPGVDGVDWSQAVLFAAQGPTAP